VTVGLALDKDDVVAGVVEEVQPIKTRLCARSPPKAVTPAQRDANAVGAALAAAVVVGDDDAGEPCALFAVGQPPLAEGFLRDLQHLGVIRKRASERLGQNLELAQPGFEGGAIAMDGKTMYINTAPQVLERERVAVAAMDGAGTAPPSGRGLLAGIAGGGELASDEFGIDADHRRVGLDLARRSGQLSDDI